mmetsp:Transcript_72843/g.126442  ORF Transcript_72843/g.126442 Transcript_72843/m.126442 type:complete len:1630 (-) Transcript_72843:238-5127(-)
MTSGDDHASIASCDMPANWLTLDAEVMKDEVHKMALRVMHIEELDVNVAVMDAGMDSIESVDFRSQLERMLPGVQLPGALVLEYPTIKDLSEYLLIARDKLAAKKEEEAKIDSKPKVVLDEELQDMEGNVVLPDGFPAAAPPCDRSGGSSGRAAMLLTGATGFLGVHIAAELLECTRGQKPPPRLMVVIRASSRSSGMQRVVDAFSDYGLPFSQADRGRVDVLYTQDLGLPNMGLNDTQMQEIREAGVHTIIHNAAMVNWFKQYHQLKATNVGSTLTLIKLAAELGAKFGYVSSISTLPLTNPDNCVNEGCDNSWPKVNVLKMSGYSQTKWVSEQLCFAACRHGIPVSVFRMPFIIGNTQTGCMNLTDTPARMITAVVQLGEAPVTVALDCVAVDVVARVCGRVSLRPQTSGVDPNLNKLLDNDKSHCVVHISTKFGKLGMEKIFEQLRISGYSKLTWVSRNDWVHRAMEQQTAAAPIQVFDRLFNRPALVNSMGIDDMEALELQIPHVMEVTSGLLHAIITFLQAKQMLPSVKAVDRRGAEICRLGNDGSNSRKAPESAGIDYEKCHQRCERDSMRYHESVAAKNLHWYNSEEDSWLTWQPLGSNPVEDHTDWAFPGGWRGWSLKDSAEGGSKVVMEAEGHKDWMPWRTALDDSAAPFYKWFVGGKTNACMNEVDRHVIGGHGDETAYVCDLNRTAQSGPVEQTLTRRQLLIESSIASMVLQREPLSVTHGDRVLIFTPTKMEQLVWTEACKRIGAIYSASTPGLVPTALAERICELEPRLVITTQDTKTQRWASSVATAMREFVPVKWVLEALTFAAGMQRRGSKASDDELSPKMPGGRRGNTSSSSLIMSSAVTEARATMETTFGNMGCVNLSNALDQIMKEVKFQLKEQLAEAGGQAPLAHSLWKLEETISKFCEDRAKERGVQVLVIDHDSTVDNVEASAAAAAHRREKEKPQFGNADAFSSAELCAKVLTQVSFGKHLEGGSRDLAADKELVADLWSKAGPPLPVDANFPLFICYTSGSSSKPHGVVHCHGYEAGVCETMRWSFGARPGEDRILAVSQPGWIVGQSYMYAAPLAMRITSVAMEGSPIRPMHTRFAEVIVRHKITILKTGSTFLREIMSYPKAVTSLRNDFDFSRVRIASFCSEPLSPQVQAFAMQNLCPQYINSYWSTEHGGMTFSRSLGSQDQLLIANAHSWPLPWISGEVLVVEDEEQNAFKKRRDDNSDNEHNDDSTVEGSDDVIEARAALPGESGDVAVMRPWPYQMRCIWGDADNVKSPTWKGDVTDTLHYWHKVVVGEGEPQWAFVQRDFAQRHHGGAYTFHGRSDEVMNLCGVTIGTETIESAILRDKHIHSSTSPVGDVAVVGHPHAVYGEMPLAFVTPSAPNVRLKEMDISRLSSLVFEAVGNVGIQFITVPELPRTQTGKILRSLLRALIKDERLGFLKAAQSIRNPGCLRQLHTQLKEWREIHHLFRSDLNPTGIPQNSSGVFVTAESDTSDSNITPNIRPMRRSSSAGRLSKGGSINGSNPDLTRLTSQNSDSSADIRGLARSPQRSLSRRRKSNSSANLVDAQAEESPVQRNDDLPVRRDTVAETSATNYEIKIDGRHLAAFTAAMTVLMIANVVLTRRR